MTSRSNAIRGLAAVLVLAMLPFASLARASEADAKDLFVRGRELRAKGDCAGAVVLFRKAQQLFPAGLGSLRNLAECEEELGKFATSRRTWLDLKRAVITAKDPKYDGWEADADAAAARLQPKVARVTIEVMVKGESGQAPMAESSKLKVTVNGELLDARLVGTTLDRDAGTYAIKIEGGKELVEKSVVVVTGETKVVHLVVEENPAEKGDKGGGTTTTFTPDVRPSNTLRTVGFVSIGVGVASFVGAGVMLAVRGSALSEIKGPCPTLRDCPAEVQGAVDRGETASALVNVFTIVGVLGVGAGVALVLTHPSSSDPKSGTTTVHLSPFASAQGGGASLWGSF